MASITDAVEIFSVCTLVQSVHNDLYYMGIGDLNPCRAASQNVTSGLNGLSAYYYIAYPAGPPISLDKNALTFVKIMNLTL
jgi:hypothetical protein